MFKFFLQLIDTLIQQGRVKLVKNYRNYLFQISALLLNSVRYHCFHKIKQHKCFSTLNNWTKKNQLYHHRSNSFVYRETWTFSVEISLLLFISILKWSIPTQFVRSAALHMDSSWATRKNTWEIYLDVFTKLNFITLDRLALKRWKHRPTWAKCKFIANIN